MGKRLNLLVLLAVILGLVLSVGTVFAAANPTFLKFFTLRVVSSRVVMDFYNKPTNFTGYHILDETGIIPGCFLVLRDNTTGQFTTTEVHASACGIGEQ